MARTKKVVEDAEVPTTKSTRTKKAPVAKAVEAETETTKTRRTRRTKRTKKDPNAPKRPLNGYMRFRQDWIAKNPKKYAEIKKEMGIPEQGKHFGQLWKELPDAKKAPFNEAFKKDMDAYNCAVAKYAATQAV